MGICADQIGYKRFVFTGYLFCAAAGLLYLFASSAPVLIAGRIIQGFGEAPVWALPPAIISLLHPAAKGKFTSWYNASIHIGLTAGSLLGLFSAGHIPEQYRILLYIFFCLIATLLIIFGLDEVNTRHRRQGKSRKIQLADAAFLVRSPAVFFVVLSVAFYGVGYGVFMTILPSYITRINPMVYSGAIFVAFYIGITTAQFIGGSVTDKSGRVIPMVTGLTLYSLGMMVYDQLTPVLVYLVLAAASFGLGLFLAGAIVFLNDQADDHSKGFASGVFYFFWGLGYFFGPIMMGFISEAGNAAFGFRVLGFFGLTLAVLVALLQERRGKKR